jgi:tetratricopeptide (TPR) repeat protein
MSEQTRIDDLRRRVEADPTSIAFAALAEEYRRAGQYDEAVAVCRTGLTRHPAYLSARVTLGRALLELNELDAAQAELEAVLKIAPENLAATRALGDIAARRGTAASVAPAPAVAPVPSHVRVPFELDLMPPSPVAAAERAPEANRAAAARIETAPAPSPVLASLERLLGAIVSLKHP